MTVKHFPHRGIAGDWHMCRREADGGLESVAEGMTLMEAIVASVVQNVVPEMIELARSLQAAREAGIPAGGLVTCRVDQSRHPGA